MAVAGITDWLRLNQGLNFEGYITGEIYKDGKQIEYLFSHVSYRSKIPVFCYYFNLTNPVWSAPNKRCIQRMIFKEWKQKIKRRK